MNTYDKYLPIGSVVRLSNGKKNVMIIGFCPLANTNGQVMYDYSGCLYPEGVFSSEYNLLFNHEQIEKVEYIGFVSPEETAFKEKLNTAIAEKQAKGELPPKGTVKSAPVVNNSQPQMFGGNINQ